MDSQGEDVDGFVDNKASFEQCLQQMESRNQGFHDLWRKILYVVAAVSFYHGMHHFVSFYLSGLHIAAGFQLTLFSRYYVSCLQS